MWFLVDELSLYRRVRSAEVMAEQLRHLASVARLPHVTMQILPAVEHPANASELIVAGEAAYIEHLAGGLVYTDEVMVTNLDRLFSSILAEANKASDSLVMIEQLEKTWTRLGGSRPIAATRKETAQK